RHAHDRLELVPAVVRPVYTENQQQILRCEAWYVGAEQVHGDEAVHHPVRIEIDGEGLRGEAPVQLQADGARFTHEGKVMPGAEEGQFLRFAERVLRLPPCCDHRFFGAYNVTLTHEDVEIIDLPERDVARDARS